jgi:hypothetical protein
MLCANSHEFIKTAASCKSSEPKHWLLEKVNQIFSNIFFLRYFNVDLLRHSLLSKQTQFDDSFSSNVLNKKEKASKNFIFIHVIYHWNTPKILSQHFLYYDLCFDSFFHGFFCQNSRINKLAFFSNVDTIYNDNLFIKTQKKKVPVIKMSSPDQESPNTKNKIINFHLAYTLQNKSENKRFFLLFFK